jgi:GST-like protein
MTEHPNVGRWFESITTRPATKRVYDGVEDVYDRPTVLSPSARRVLFEQDAATTKCG